MKVSGNHQSVRPSLGFTASIALASSVLMPSIVMPSVVFATHGTTMAAAISTAHLTRLEVLVFSTPLESFIQASSRPTGADASFDWTTDLCSAPLIGSTGRSFDFSGACSRHDFAYRNYKRVDVAAPQRGHFWNSTMRHRIDLRFRHDMKAHCSRRAITEKGTCLAWAEVFYRLVRVAGGP